MSVTVLDSSNLAAVLADATGEPVEEGGKETSKADEKAESKENTDSDGKGDTQTEEKAPEKKDAKQEDEKEEKVDPDDVEGDDGLTPRQKRDFTQTMLKTIGKKHRQMKEAEEFAAAQYNQLKLAEKRAADLERQLQTTQTKPEEQQAREAAKPKPENYQSQEEYIDALTEWKVEEKIRVRDEQRARDELISSARERLNRAKELIPDYREVLDAAGDTLIPPAVAGYMQKSPMLAELTYYFCKNTNILVSLQNLSPDEQLVKIGKIEATLKPFSESAKDSSHGEKPSSTETKTVSEIVTGKAPSKARNTAPVIQPISATGTVDKEPQDMNIRETIADWQKRNSANLHMRKRH